MPVTVRTRRKFRGLARSRIELGLDVIGRLLRYQAKHPEKELFTIGDLAAIGIFEDALTNALAATVPVG